MAEVKANGRSYERGGRRKSLVSRSFLKGLKINFTLLLLLAMLADRIASLSCNYSFTQQNFIEHILCNKSWGG